MNDKVQRGIGTPGGDSIRPSEPAAPAVDISLQDRRSGPRVRMGYLLLGGVTAVLFLGPPLLLTQLLPDMIFVTASAGMVFGLLLVVVFLALTQGVFTWQWVAMKPLRALGAGRLLEAEQYFGEAQQYCDRFAVHDYRRGFMLRTLADYRNFQGRFADAKTLYLAALEIQKKNLPQRPADYCDTLNNCSILYQFQEDFASAESLLEQGVSVIRSCSLSQVVWSSGPTTEMNLLYNLARACTGQKKFDRALEVLSQIRPPAGQQTNHADHWLAERAVVALRQGRFADAIGDCEKVSQKNCAMVSLTLAEAHLGLRHYKEAEELLRGHLEKWEKLPGVRFGDPLLLMGRCRLEQKQLPSALTYLDRTRRLYHDQGMLGLPSWAETLEEWARILAEQGNVGLADQLRTEARQVHQPSPDTAIIEKE